MDKGIVMWMNRVLWCKGAKKIVLFNLIGMAIAK